MWPLRDILTPTRPSQMATPRIRFRPRLATHSDLGARVHGVPAPAPSSSLPPMLALAPATTLATSIGGEGVCWASARHVACPDAPSPVVRPPLHGVRDGAGGGELYPPSVHAPQYPPNGPNGAAPTPYISGGGEAEAGVGAPPRCRRPGRARAARVHRFGPGISIPTGVRGNGPPTAAAVTTPIDEQHPAAHALSGGGAAGMLDSPNSSFITHSSNSITRMSSSHSLREQMRGITLRSSPAPHTATTGMRASNISSNTSINTTWQHRQGLTAQAGGVPRSRRSQTSVRILSDSFKNDTLFFPNGKGAHADDLDRTTSSLGASSFQRHYSCSTVITRHG